MKSMTHLVKIMVFVLALTLISYSVGVSSAAQGGTGTAIKPGAYGLSNREYCGMNAVFSGMYICKLIKQNTIR